MFKLRAVLCSTMKSRDIRFCPTQDVSCPFFARLREEYVRHGPIRHFVAILVIGSVLLELQCMCLSNTYFT